MDGKKLTNIASVALVGAVGVWIALDTFIFTGEDSDHEEYFSDEENPFSFEPNGFEKEGIPEEDFGISTSNPIATEVGMSVMKQGGNAIDAAVASSYVLGVVEPYGSGVGGGGMALVRDEDGDVTAYDYREAAPLSGAMSGERTGFPGFVQGMERMHEEYGIIDIDLLIEPAVQIAESGFEVDSSLARQLSNMSYYVEGQGVETLFPNGRHNSVNSGDLITNEDMAETLAYIQENGSEGFYNEWIKEDLNRFGFTDQDINEYEIIEKEPAEGSFFGFDVHSASAPLTGVSLVQALYMVEQASLSGSLENEVDRHHIMGEIMKETYSDRLTTMGDPRFENVDQEVLTSERYIENMMDRVDVNRLSGIEDVFDTQAEIDGHDNTTHLSIVDSEGMAVSSTHSLSEFFGSGYYTNGFFMNNQLKNFSESSDSLNNHEPGKRPRSFVTPTILTKDESEEILAIGSPGGRRIPMMLTQVLTKIVLDEQGLEEAVEEPRFYIESNRVLFERGVSPEVEQGFRELGYSLAVQERPLFYGGIQVIHLNDDGEIDGAGDSRRDGRWDANLREE